MDPTPTTLLCGRFRLALDRPLVMGVVNVTPDSFHDGGRHATREAAVAHALGLVEQGADIVDVGGESTRPGAQPVTPEVELERVLPVLQALSGCGRPVSVDTRRPEVMRAVLAAGADMINDIAGFDSAEAVAAVADSSAALCVMHMRGEPSTMQRAPVYRDVVGEVAGLLYARVATLVAAGVAPERIVVDPGIGFGKTQEHNVALLRALPALAARGRPVLIGVSRKSLVGWLAGRPATDDRLAGSLAAALFAATHGARILRVHDVAATRDALAVWRGLAQDASGDAGTAQ